MAISLVQSKIGSTTSGSTLTVTLNSGTTAGNCVVVALMFLGSTTNPSGVSGITLGGSAGNFASAIIEGASSTTTPGTAIWTNPNCAGGQTAVAITLTGGSGTIGMIAFVYEVSGVASTSVVDKTQGTTKSSNSTSFTSNATATTTNAVEFWVGIGASASGSALTLTGPSSPWSNLANTQATIGGVSTAAISGSQITSSTAAATYSGTINQSTNDAACVITLNPGSSNTGATGTPATMALAAPAGSVTAGAAVAGAAAALTFAAPAGSVSVGVGVTGLPAGLTFAAPAGTVTAGANVVGATAALTLAAPAGSASGGTAGLTIVNSWKIGGDVDGYGGQYTKITNTLGNGLVAYLCCGVGNPDVLPRFTIADDAHNWWVFCGTETAVVAGANRRVDVWIAPNARAANYVMTGESWVFSGMVGAIYEVAGLPQYVDVDFVAVSSGSGTSASCTGTASTADYVFGAVVLSGPGSNTAITNPSGWSVLAPQNTNSLGTFGDMRDEYLSPSYHAVTAGSVSPSWSWSGTSDYLTIAVGILQSPPAPTQVNANWPALKVEAAFGYMPGQTGVATSYPTWTDITNYVVDEDGASEMKFQRGRSYELTQPEAGTGKLNLLNNTGAFNPVNSSSPFYPNVLPEVPVRVSAYWNGSQYGIGYVYASKWPQDFPEPQWGMTNFSGTDAISVASNIALGSAYAGEVLADQPYVYLPLGEFYDEASGEPFSNLSRYNQRPAYGVDDSAAKVSLETDLGGRLAGDPATGIGTSAFVAGTSNAGIGAAGAIYRDANLPSLANGFTVECWASAGPATQQVTLISVQGAPSNYNNSSLVFPSVGDGNRLSIELFTGASSITAAANLSGYLPSVSGITSGAAVATDSPQGSMHHYVATCVNNGGTWTVQMYVDGTNVASATGTSVPANIDAYMLGIGPVILNGGSRAWCNYSITQVAVYPIVLSSQRILAHYNTMNTASAGDLVDARFGKLLSWSGAGIPGVATNPSPSPAIGNADQIQGQAIADALYALATEEGGMYYCPATSQGEIYYSSRVNLYNKAPKYVFGDNTSAGEVPYLPGSGFDFDDQFLFNIVSSERTISASTEIFVSGGQASLGQYNSYGVNAITADTTSEGEYFPRGPLQQDVETTSDQDAYDRANWSLVKYKQPHLRANQIQLDPASNPSIWAVALGVEQGDVITINRRPLGGPVISLNCMVQQVQHEVGPSHWKVTLSLSPYFPENAVIQLDNTSWNTPGSGVLGW